MVPELDARLSRNVHSSNMMAATMLGSIAVPDFDEFNMNYRPKSYWGPQNVETWIGSDVKGELRKRQAIEESDDGHFDPEFMAESLSDEHRSAVGSAHPWYMGGEYLPDLLRNEVEIARVTMKSTTMDVVSIRARKTKHRIVYRIVDEYDPESWAEQYTLTKRTSVKPLAMWELIQLIDSAVVGGLVGSGRERNYSESGYGFELEDPKEYYDFETASSAYYLELERWYDTLNEEWLEEERNSIPRRKKVKKNQLAAEVAATRSAANDRDPKALTALGYYYLLGRGVELSQEHAVECWTVAAELGDPRGTFNLAVCLHDGIGVSRDQKRALELYERLAEDRFYVGFKLAGYCRHVGIGCAQDRYKALRWYFEIAKSGNTGVNGEILKCLRNMGGETDLEKEVVGWIRERPPIARENMLNALSKGPTEDPVKHDAGYGYLGTDALLRLE